MRTLATLLGWLVVALAFAAPAFAQDAAETEPVPYTTFQDGKDAAWPTDTRRIALLIGNNDYQKIGMAESDPSAAPLKNLGNACADARLMGITLTRIGWKKDEVVVLCNQTKGGIQDALDALAAAAPSDPDKAKLVVVYLAGHGMQVNDKTYFFGVNARPKFADAATNVVYGEGRPLFSRDAVEVKGYMTLNFGSRVQTPVLLIVDACRDNPMYAHIRTAYEEAYRRRQEERNAQPNLPEPVRLTYSAPSGSGGSYPSGMLVAFASTDGATVEDEGGNGNGRLADSFARRLERKKTVNALVSLSLRAVETDTMTLSQNRKQRPDTTGYLLPEPDGQEWCFYGCRRPGPESDARLRGGATRFAAADGGRLTRIAYAQPASPAVQKKSNIEILYKGPVPAEKAPYRLEVNWCDADGRERDPRREVNARAFAAAVARNVATSAATEYAQYGMVVLQRVSEDANEKAGVQMNDTAIFTKRGDAVEQALADRSVKAAKAKLHIIDRRSSYANVVEAYFCSGAYPDERAPKVFVQVPSARNLHLGTKIIDELTFSYPTLNVVQKAEAVPQQSPRTTQVRYFSPSMKGQAEALATSLANLLGVEVEPKATLGYAGPVTRRQLEVWLGAADAERVKAPPQVQLIKGVID